jgi:hypothetical protein
LTRSKARSGLIYHEFDYMEYFASKSSSGSEAEKEDSWSKDSEALENEAKKAQEGQAGGGGAAC